MKTKHKSITDTLLSLFTKKESFTLKDAYIACPENNKESVRSRIYENLNIKFERINKGVYKTKIKDEEAILVEGNGRDLSFIKDESIDAIITDHPWSDKKSNKGGNRNFTQYDTFSYTQEDFNEKIRVLKDGAFLIEFIPNENANNFDYLYQIKKMAEKAGFQYYAKVPWKKGNFVANTGRTTKNSEDVLIFTKKKARLLKTDAKKNKKDPTKKHFMSGAKEMLPAAFDFQPPNKKERIHQSEKPIDLLKKLITLITNKGEIILDQFAGSGVTLDAAIQTGRKAIGIECDPTNCKNILNRFANNNQSLFVIN